LTITHADEDVARDMPVANSPSAVQSRHLIILYDGACGLCNDLVKFAIARDRTDRFRFLPLQTQLATATLTKHQADFPDTNTMYVESPGGQLFARSDAAIAILRELNGWWRFVAFAIRVVPQSLRDWGYGLIARNRYRIFGQHESCRVPSETDRHKFLDIH
jgi:predicted DCC family thiol-disulfide oxidoreductase YuxK